MEWTQEVFRYGEEAYTESVEAPVLAYFDNKKEVAIQADASQGGLVAGWLHQGFPITYTFRELTKQYYASLEKKC